MLATSIVDYDRLMRSTPQDEQARSATLGTALTGIEGDYFFDYAVFGGALRTYVASALEAQYLREPSEMHRRAFILALYREEYTAYEDLGAFLHAMLSASVDPQVVPLERILNYGPGDVHLKKVLGRHQVTSGDDLFARLALKDWIPTWWSTRHPDVDLDKVLRRVCYLFAKDGVENQREQGLRGFNKIKHGLVLVPEGREYRSALPSAPAVIFKTDKKNAQAQANPLTIMSIPIDAAAFEGRLRSIHFFQLSLRLLAILYVVKSHPSVIGRRGFAPQGAVFDSAGMVDVLEFARQSSSTVWP